MRNNIVGNQYLWFYINLMGFVFNSLFSEVEKTKQPHLIEMGHRKLFTTFVGFHSIFGSYFL